MSFEINGLYKHVSPIDKSTLYLVIAKVSPYTIYYTTLQHNPRPGSCYTHSIFAKKLIYLGPFTESVEKTIELYPEYSI